VKKTALYWELKWIEESKARQVSGSKGQKHKSRIFCLFV
jgi:hypothetical protein